MDGIKTKPNQFRAKFCKTKYATFEDVMAVVNNKDKHSTIIDTRPAQMYNAMPPVDAKGEERRKIDHIVVYV